MFIIDMENIELMEYTPITLEDITPVGYDGKKFQWLYDAGLKVMAPETHAVVILK
jgi:hypothetical protein